MAWAEKLPSGRWRGVYRDAAGRRRSLGETFTHKPRAERASAAAEQQARRSVWADPDASRRTWGEWCEQWWSTRTVEPSTLVVDASRRRTHLDPRWGDVPIGAIRRHDVYAWVSDLSRRGVGASTVQRTVHLLSASLAAAVDAQVIDANPAARIKLSRGSQAQERFLTREEYRQLLDAMPTSYDQLVVNFLAFTGMRWGEMSGLHWNRVDVDRGVARVVEVFDEKTSTIKAYPKGRRVRDVPLPTWLLEELQSRPRQSGCGLPHVSGRCRSGLVLTTQQQTVLRGSNWSRVWRAAVGRADIGHVRIHDLRHTYASWLLQGGVPIARVGQLLGHASTATTAKYAHLDEAPSDQVLSVLSAPRLPHDGTAPRWGEAV